MLMRILDETFPPNCQGFSCAGLKLVQNVHLVVLSYLLVKKYAKSMLMGIRRSQKAKIWILDFD
jgi:hypothetical protein